VLVDDLAARNPGLIRALQWTAILDGRTTLICAGRDGRFTPVGGNVLPVAWKKLIPPTARPPAHPECRSIMTIVFSGPGISSMIGNRPFLRSTRTGKERLLSFRQSAQQQAGSRWLKMSEASRKAAVSAVQKKWETANIGTVPATTTFGPWLRTQSAEFQDQYLGKTKGQLFRSGGLKIDQFTDSLGRPLTVRDMATRRPDAFKQAGLDAGDFL